MPPVIIGAAISAGVGAVVGGAAFATLFVQNLALGAISMALNKKPKASAVEARDNTHTSKNSIASRKTVYGRTRIGGTVVYMESTGSDNKYLHLVLAMASHEIDAYEKVYFGDQLVWDGGTYQDSWATYARINFHKGDQTTADSDLVAESSHWTSSHILNGVAYMYLRLKYDRDQYPDGIPNVSAVVRGKKIYDPRTGQTVWTQNPALCIRDYLVDTKYGMSASSLELNNASFVAAANLSDELVTTTEGAKKRYTLNGVVDTADDRRSIIEALLTSMAGSLIYSGGEFYVYGSAYKTPTITLDESIIVGDISVQTKRSKRELFNGVKGTFPSYKDNYIVTDYPAIISSTYVAADGEPSYLDVDMPYTTDVLEAQRLAKLSLLRSRKQITASIRCNLTALKLKAGDTVMVSNERMGWTNKVFEVTNLSFEADQEGRLNVALNVIETSADVYDWTTADEIDYIAGQPTSLAYPFSVAAPTSFSVTAVSNIQADGTARPAFEISYTNNDAFAYMFEIQYRVNSGSYRSILTSETNYRLEDVIVGGAYDFQVRAVNRVGARSPFATTTATGTGDTNAPSAPTSLAAEGQANAVFLSWTNPSDNDLDVIQIYESADSVQANAVLVGTTRGNSFMRGGLQNGVTRYYWIKATDYSGNASAFNSATGVDATTVIPVDETLFVGNVKIVDTLTTGYGVADTGRLEFLTTDEKIYRWSGSAWESGVLIDEAAGTVVAQQLSVTTLDAITANMGTINAGKLQNDDQTFVVDLDNKKIYIA